MKLFSSGKRAQDYRPVVESEKQSPAGMLESVRLMVAGKNNKRSTASGPTKSIPPVGVALEKDLKKSIKRSMSTEKTGVLTLAISISESLSEEFSCALNNTLTRFEAEPSESSPLKDTRTNSDSADAGRLMNGKRTVGNGGEAATDESSTKDDRREKLSREKSNNNKFSLHPSASNGDWDQINNILLLEDLQVVEHEYENIELHIKRAACVKSPEKEDGQGIGVKMVGRSTPETNKNKKQGVGVASSPNESQDELEEIELLSFSELRPLESDSNDSPLVSSSRRVQQPFNHVMVNPMVPVPLHVPNSHCDLRSVRTDHMASISPLHSVISSASGSSNTSGSGSRAISLLDASHYEDDGNETHVEPTTNSIQGEKNEVGNYSYHIGNFGGEELQSPRSTYTIQTEFPDDDTMAVLEGAFSHMVDCAAFRQPRQQQYMTRDNPQTSSSTPQLHDPLALLNSLFGCGG